MKRRWWQRQRSWYPGGWWIMYTWGHMCGIGVVICGWHRLAMRVNGFEIWLGPINIMVRPPTPKWLLEDNGKQPVQSPIVP